MRHREDMFRHIKQSGETWKERRETIIDALERRIEITREIYHQLVNFPKDLPVEEAEDRLDDLFEIAVQNIPEEKFQRLARYESISKKVSDYYERLSEYGTDDLSFLDENEEPEDEIGALEDEEKQKIDQLDKEGQNIKADPDIDFLRNILAIQSAYKEKYRQAREFESDPQSIVDHLNQWHRKSEESEAYILSPDDIAQTRIDAFNVNVVLKNEAYEQVQDTTSSGVHRSGSVINLIKERRTHDLKRTMRHEGIHNFLDVFKIDDPFQFRRVNNSIERYFKLKAQKVPQRIMDYELNILRSINIEQVLDSQKNELLAQFQTVENIYIDNDLSNLDTDDKFKFMLFTTDFATAGSRFQDFNKQLTEYIYQADDKLAPILKSIQQKFRTVFISMAKEMLETVQIAKTIGEDAREFAYMSFVILNPSQYKKYKKILRSHVGEERYEMAVREKEMSLVFDGSLQSLRKLVEKMENDPAVAQTIIDKGFLADKDPGFNLRNSGVQSESLDIHSIDELREYLALFSVIEKKFDTNPLNEFKDEVLYLFFDNIFMSLSFDRCKADDYDLSSLNKIERIKFSEVAESHIVDGFLYEDLLENLNREPTLEDAYASEFWKIVAQAGIQNEIDDLIKKVFKKKAA